MRLFIAVNIPKRSKKLIKNKVEMIKPEITENIKWVKSKNWHLTLKFLGEVEKKKISDIKKTLNLLEDRFNSFSLNFKGIGAFPHLNQPQVVFIQVEKGKEKLIELHKKVDEKLQEQGFKSEDRSYHPHLTIARSRNSTDKNKLSNSLNEFTGRYFINVYMKVSNISLMESKLFPDGPVYEKKQEIFLKKP